MRRAAFSPPISSPQGFAYSWGLIRSLRYRSFNQSHLCYLPFACMHSAFVSSEGLSHAQSADWLEVSNLHFI